MADIRKEVEDFRTAYRGEQVRGSMISLAEKVNADGEKALTEVGTQVEAVGEAVKTANAAAKAAQDAIDHANDISAEYKQYADDRLTETTEQRQLAETAKQGSDIAASLSQSWADGKTGTREGEDSNNSRYFSEQSKAQADRSTTEADRAAQYANIVAPGFCVDPETMELYIKAGVGVSFIVTADCELCWKVA